MIYRFNLRGARPARGVVRVGADDIPELRPPLLELNRRDEVFDDDPALAWRRRQSVRDDDWKSRCGVSGGGKSLTDELVGLGGGDGNVGVDGAALKDGGRLVGGRRQLQRGVPEV